jgi:DNA-binding CsgD family transcriptional regulator
VNDQLTAREAQVVALIAEGRTNPEIAAALQIGRSTVAAHIVEALRKRGARNRTELALFQFREALVQLAEEFEDNTLHADSYPAYLRARALLEPPT